MKLKKLRKTYPRIFKPREIDIAVIWRELSEKLTKYYSKEGFTYTNIIEVLPHVIDLFEKLLYEGVEKNEKD